MDSELMPKGNAPNESAPNKNVRNCARFRTLFSSLREGFVGHLRRIRVGGIRNGREVLRFGLHVYSLLLYTYTMILSPLALLFFIGYIEWFIWGTDPGGESFRHIGQWGVIVAVVLVFAAAVIPRIHINLLTIRDILRLSRVWRQKKVSAIRQGGPVR
jgi:hypothetical protein